MTRAAKVVTVMAPHGPVLVSADVHGNWADFARLREIYLELWGAGRDPVWISVGDWVHGPDAEGRRSIRALGPGPDELLYDYVDDTPAILRNLFALMDAHPGRVLSICGNHEHAHIGGRRTRKFHDDEAAVLEARLGAAEIAELRRRFASWPMVVRLPGVAVVVTHGALGAELDGPEDLEAIDYAGKNQGRAAELLHTGMTRYGFAPGEDERLLERMGAPGEYRVLVHGHDREEDGWAASGERAGLLCTSFGARRERKAYLLLERRLDGLGDVRDGVELRRLWG
jgi:Calcineurin-like phosphoesterase